MMQILALSNNWIPAAYMACGASSFAVGLFNNSSPSYWTRSKFYNLNYAFDFWAKKRRYQSVDQSLSGGTFTYRWHQADACTHMLLSAPINFQINKLLLKCSIHWIHFDLIHRFPQLSMNFRIIGFGHRPGWFANGELAAGIVRRLMALAWNW